MKRKSQAFGDDEITLRKKSTLPRITVNPNAQSLNLHRNREVNWNVERLNRSPEKEKINLQEFNYKSSKNIFKDN